MPIPLAPVIAAAGQIASSGINAMATGKMNRKTRKWNEKMYAQQRADSISDWERENSYNHPSEQMARLRKAGLNPNLVYGNGATAEGGHVRSTDVKSWNPSAPQFDIGGGISAYMDARTNEATVDNLRVQNQVLEQERALKAAQTAGTIATTFLTQANTDRSKFDLGLSSELRQTSLEAAKANLDKTHADIDGTRANTEMTKTQIGLALNRDEREAAMNASNLWEAAERVLTMQKSRSKTDKEMNEIDARIKNIHALTKNQEFINSLNIPGVDNRDPIYWRYINALMRGSVKLDELKQELKNHAIESTDKMKDKKPKWMIDAEKRDRNK